MARGRQPNTNREINWVTDEDGNVLGYMKDAKTLVATAEYSLEQSSRADITGVVASTGSGDLVLPDGVTRFRPKLQLFAKKLQDNPVFGKVMASPPTITISPTDNAPTSLSGSVWVPVNDASKVTVNGALTSFFTNGLSHVVYNLTSIKNRPSIAFCTDALDVEFELNVSSTLERFGIVVDGEWLQNTPLTYPSATAGNWTRQYKITFATRRMREIQLFGSSLSGVAGFYVTNKDVVHAAPDRATLKTYILSDSYGGANVLGAPDNGFVNGLLAANEFKNFIHSQVGGTGYVNSSPFLGRLQAIVASDGVPDCVITAGGINDTANATLETAINSYFSYCASINPHALHIVYGPWMPKLYLNGGGKYTAITNYIKSALAASGLKNWVFLDTVNGGWLTSFGTSSSASGPWFNGNGNEGATTGSGNSDFYIGTDGTHPNNAGSLYLTERSVREVSAALQSMIN